MVCCFGELLLRMSPAAGGQWIGDATMPVYVGGAELNVAVALSNWGVPVRYTTAMPDHYLAQQIISYIASKRIDTSTIRLTGERIGTYYLPQGSDLKHAGVIYDRAYSSFASLRPGVIDWDEVFSGCTCFHFSAISPALTELTAELCREALEAATRLGLKISVDLNYRSKLWQYGSSPLEVMPELVNYCHVIMGNLWAVESMLGLESTVTESKGRSIAELTDAAQVSMHSVRMHYPLVRMVAYTFRLASEYFAVLEDQRDASQQYFPVPGERRDALDQLQVSQEQHHQPHVSSIYPIGEVVDRVGSGDCFMAGLIDGFYKGRAGEDIVNYAAAAAVGKLHEHGDSTEQSIDDVRKRVK